MSADEPCEKHELAHCAYCTGVDDETEVERGPLPLILGGPTIHAHFAGNCAGCGRRFPPGTAIHHPSEREGWVGVDCCHRSSR